MNKKRKRHAYPVPGTKEQLADAVLRMSSRFVGGAPPDVDTALIARLLTWAGISGWKP